MEEIRETIEGLKEMPDYPLFPERSRTISHAIQILQAHEQAEGELGKETTDYECSDSCPLCEFNKGYNQMHLKARPILAKALLRIEDLKEDLSCAKGTIKYYEEKLTMDNIKRIMDECGYIGYERNSKLAQTLIEELTGEKK